MLSKQKPGAKTGPGPTHWFSTSVAREKISQIVMLAQDPRAAVILTRHGKPVAAVVSMAELKRIEGQQDVEDISVNGVRKHRHWFGPSELGAKTLAEAGEKIQALQLDRLMEREVLEKAGLPVVEGGELAAVVEVKVRKWWWPFRRR
ncbi:MAG: type II toxin-antitoxin system Phd/YefM family antitoxin [Pseudomonadota bacterium]